MVIAATKKWLEEFVVALNICPFAGRELVKESVRFIVTEAISERELLSALESQLSYLLEHDEIETTLLIHPNVLERFLDYNEFLGDADQLLVEKELEGVFQIASFHPQYQFAGTDLDDAENYTNRSPYPLLHILREASVEMAIASYPDVEQIPARNISEMKRLGSDNLSVLLRGFTER